MAKHSNCSLSSPIRSLPFPFSFLPLDRPILFLDQSQFEPPEQAVCFLENMKVVVNGGQLLNHEGVEVRPRDWGGVDGLMFQDMHQKIPSYYKHFVETMEKNGWKRGKTLFGAPYDWRYAQLRIDDHYDKMQALIEEIYASTGKPVSIYGHSMGPTVGLAFLHRMTQPWKDRHIAVFMASAPVWTGSVVSVWSAISGLDCKSAFGHDCPGAEGGLGRALLRELADSMPASFATMTLPGDPETDPSTWGKDEVIIKTPSKTYSAHDLHEIMTDLGLKDGAAVQQIVAKDLGATTFKAPLVDTHVYYGFGVPTPSTFEYDVDFAPLKIGEGPPQESKIVRSVDDAGDGVVRAIFELEFLALAQPPPGLCCPSNHMHQYPLEVGSLCRLLSNLSNVHADDVLACALTMTSRMHCRSR